MFNDTYSKTDAKQDLSSILLMDAIKSTDRVDEMPAQQSSDTIGKSAENFISQYESMTRDDQENSSEPKLTADKTTEDFDDAFSANENMSLRWWEKIFAKKSVGLEINSRSVRAAVIKSFGKRRTIQCLEEIEFPAGKSDDPVVSAEYVKQLCRRLKARSDQVVSVIGGNDVTLRLVKIPKLSKNEIHGALLWKNKKELHFFNDAPTVLNYVILEEESDTPANELQVLVIAVKADLIKNHIDLLDRADLLPGKLTVKAFAQWNVARSSLDKGLSSMTIDIGYDSTHVSFFNDRALQFAREIPIGGNHFTTALMQTIFVDNASFLLSWEEAEQIKKEMGLMLEPLKGKTSQGIPYPEIGVMMRPVAEKLAAEIKMSLDYYRENFKAKSLDRVWVTGNGVRLKNLTSFLEFQIGSSVQVLKPYEQMAISSHVKNDNSNRLVSFVDTVGAALSRGPELNFLPQTIRTELTFRKVFSASVSGLLIVLISLVGLTFLLNKKNLDAINIIQILKDSAARQQIQNRECDLLQTQINNLQSVESTLRQEIKVDSTMNNILKLMSNVTPEEIVVDELTWGTNYNQTEINRTKTAKKMEANGNAGSMPSRKNELRIKGSVYKDVFYGDIHLLSFIGALERSQFFKEVTLKEKRRDETDDKLFFEILSELKTQENQP